MLLSVFVAEPHVAAAPRWIAQLRRALTRPCQRIRAFTAHHFADALTEDVGYSRKVSHRITSFCDAVRGCADKHFLSTRD
jgi:hypothetical protein